MKPTYPDPRFAVLLLRRVVVHPADEHDEEIEFDWHRNHRIYLSAPTARANANTQVRRARADGEVVIKIDPALCEPDGMTPQQEYEFCEQMVEHWAKRAMAARAKAEAGIDTAQFNPRRRAKNRKEGGPKDRRQRRAQAKLGNLAKQALVMGAASALGAILGNALSKPAAPNARPPAGSTKEQPGLLDVFSLPKGPSDGG